MNGAVAVTLWKVWTRLKKDRLARPQLLVEAPLQVLEPGRIARTFEQPQQALEKLLALAMTISNGLGRFERQVPPGSLNG